MGKENQASSRRNFLWGLVTGVGVATVAMASVGKARSKPGPAAKKPTGPVLYRRTAETERYHKTLYT